MNDFLSNLTARSFDLAAGIELVRPRLPSLFESTPAKRHEMTEAPSTLGGTEEFENSNRGGSLWVDHQEPMQLDGNSEPQRNSKWNSVQPFEDKEREPSRPDGAVTATKSKAHVREDANNFARPQYSSLDVIPKHLRQKVIENAASQATVRSETPERTMMGVSCSTTPTLSDSESKKPENADVVIEKMRPGPERPPKQAAVPPIVVEKVQLVERNNQVIDRELPLVKKENENRGPAMVRPVFQPIGAIFDPRRERPCRKAVTKPQPTINVTIGRIEVRSATASKVEKRKTAPTAMTLDEYLGRRTGGRS